MLLSWSYFYSPGALSIRTNLTPGPTTAPMVKGVRSGLTPRPKSSTKDFRLPAHGAGADGSMGGTAGEAGKEGGAASLFQQATSPDAFMRYGFTLEGALVSRRLVDIRKAMSVGKEADICACFSLMGVDVVCFGSSNKKYHSNSSLSLREWKRGHRLPRRLHRHPISVIYYHLTPCRSTACWNL